MKRDERLYITGRCGKICIWLVFSSAAILARLSATAPIEAHRWTASSGTAVWSDPQNWSKSIVPSTGTPVKIDAIKRDAETSSAPLNAGPTISGTEQEVSDVVVASCENSTGVLSILNQAKLKARTVFVGYKPGSQGTCVVGTDARVQCGSLILGLLGAGQLVLRDNGQLCTPQLFVGYHSGSRGTLNIGPPPDEAPQTPGTFVGRLCRLGTHSSSLNFNHTAQDYVFESHILGGGNVDIYNGITTLLASSHYTGHTTVYGGSLNIQGCLTHSQVYVKPGGRLTGTGSMKSLTSRGRTTPGTQDSTGTLTVKESLTFASDHTLVIRASIQQPQAFDSLQVGGNAVLSGTLQVFLLDNDEDELQLNKYRIISASQGITGAFAKIECDASGYEVQLQPEREVLWLTIIKSEPSKMISCPKDCTEEKHSQDTPGSSD